MRSYSQQLVFGLMLATAVVVSAVGCQQPLSIRDGNIFTRDQDFAELLAKSNQQLDWSNTSAENRLAKLAGLESNEPDTLGSAVAEPNHEPKPASSFVAQRSIPQIAATKLPSSKPVTVRAQSPDEPIQDNSFSPAGGFNAVESGSVQPAAAQFPELATPDRPFIPGNGLNSPNIGSPNEQNPLISPFQAFGNAPVPFPANYADLDIFVTETDTGRLNFGGAFNTDNGLVGQFTLEEKNFDITRFPRRFRDITDGTAWRGAGQTFRLELVPGSDVERYLVSFTEPYLFGTNYSLSVSGYLFDRQFFDWDEERLGGRIQVGRGLTHDISISAGLRLESVTIDNPRLTSSPQLNEVLGTSNLFLANVGLIRDTRNSQVEPTTGSYLALTYSQGFGDFDYSRGDIDIRRYKLLRERADGSGRHTISFGTKLGFSGSDTPVFENYFAGGFATLRGFDFRGAAPLEGGVRVGGEFQWLNTLEYTFPITADDNIKGVVFCDFGTVEENIELNSENFRVAPGFGLRVKLGAIGGGAPLAFDFAFPVATAPGDEEQVFSFFLGAFR